MVRITGLRSYDLRFPTSEGMHGSDAMHKDPDYSAPYVVLETDQEGLEGHGLSFTLGRGNEVILACVEAMQHLVVGKQLEDITANFGQYWSSLSNESQLRWLGPEKGVIHMAQATIVNAIWDLWAKKEGKPVWRLLVDLSPEEVVSLIPFKWITDALTPEEALQILQANEPLKAERIQKMLSEGYPAYTTSAGWLGYSDETIRELCRRSISDGWSVFKVKVGSDLEDDKRRLAVIREEIGDRRMMVDANQKWDVDEAINWMKELASFKPWFIEEPTSPDDVLGHAKIRKALAPLGIEVATGEHCQNRIMFKQFFQAEALGICQLDSCRLGSLNEIIAVLLMAAKFGVTVMPHAGGVGLCEYVQHIIFFDYVYCCGSTEERWAEFVDHLHEHFVHPCVVKNGCYMPPQDPGYSTQMHAASIEEYSFPDGPVWKAKLQSH